MGYKAPDVELAICVLGILGGDSPSDKLTGQPSRLIDASIITLLALRKMPFQGSADSLSAHIQASLLPGAGAYSKAQTIASCWTSSTRYRTSGLKTGPYISLRSSSQSCGASMAATKNLCCASAHAQPRRREDARSLVARILTRSASGPGHRRTHCPQLSAHLEESAADCASCVTEQGSRR